MFNGTDTPDWTICIAEESGLPDVAACIVPILKPGVPVALSGELGAGKTAFARALVQNLADDLTMEVPSPTFSLVQDYETPHGIISHFDLYRIDDPDELIEVGFEDALNENICLIEWPEKAAGLPETRINISIANGPDDTYRVFEISGSGAAAGLVDRMQQLAHFIDASDWAGAKRRRLHGDASSRAYELLTLDGRQAILMNAPEIPDGPVIRDGRTYSDIAKLAENNSAFLAVASTLRLMGFNSPEIYAVDRDNGFSILEYFGSETIVEIKSAKPVEKRYSVAVDVLSKMHTAKWPVSAQFESAQHPIPKFDLDAFLIETELLLDWFYQYLRGEPASDALRQSFTDNWTKAFENIDTANPVWCLRDYHSPNLHWIENNKGLARIGLIDFQDAVFGHPAYDLVSLLQDARVTIESSMEERLLDRYMADWDVGPGAEQFAVAYATLGAQRNTKILGIFVRLARRDNKPGYLKHLPRISDYLKRNLAHPALRDIADWYEKNLPEALAAAPAMFEEAEHP